MKKSCLTWLFEDLLTLTLRGCLHNTYTTENRKVVMHFACSFTFWGPENTNFSFEKGIQSASF